MFVTFDTFQLPNGWLNVLALPNIDDMLVTLDTSHEPIGWFIALARPNIPDMFVTPDTSHVAILPLPVLPAKVLAPKNMLAVDAPN
jgi:hypothetical protein